MTLPSSPVAGTTRHYPGRQLRWDLCTHERSMKKEHDIHGQYFRETYLYIRYETRDEGLQRTGPARQVWSTAPHPHGGSLLLFQLLLSPATLV